MRVQSIISSVVILFVSYTSFAQDSTLSKELESAVDSENLFDAEISEIYSEDVKYLKEGKKLTYKFKFSEYYGYQVAAASLEDLGGVINITVYKGGRKYDYAYDDDGYHNATIDLYIEKSGTYKVVVEMLQCPQEECPVLFKAFRYE